jgi:hypothetical protein
MAKPIFTKSGNAYSPFTFEKSRFLPANQPITPRQLIGIATGGVVKVADVGDPDEFFEIVINRVSKTNRDNLLGFLQDSTVNYSLYTFTFIDENSTSYTVRLWNVKGLDFPMVRGGLYNIKLTLRKEIT